MDYKLSCQESEVLTVENVRNGSMFNLKETETDTTVKDEIPVLSAHESARNIPSDNLQIATTANDLLQNGILVETNKGLVCMSLKDVLSSNLNLSEEDFQKVATQLLSQQGSNQTESELPNEDDQENDNNAVDSSQSKVVTVATMPSQNVPSKSIPVTMEISYKSNVGSSSDESTNVTYTSDILLVENLEHNTIKTEVTENTYVDCEIQPFGTSNPLINKTVDGIVKRRGGWPKGRKRKPELLNLPPKAPKTSYNLFLNERRKLYKDKLAFHEITRVVGNQWSNLSAEEKLPYIEKAEEDKKRYREELMAYRQSDVYQLYLASKRKKRAMDNLLSESDMDGTDDIEDEDNDILYCDMCDQWFYNLHNKREHLLSRQHKMLVTGDMTRELASSDSEYKGHISSVSFSTSLDESSLDAAPVPPVCSSGTQKLTIGSESVSDYMSNLFATVTQRETEIKILQARLKESVSKKTFYLLELGSLKDKASEIKNELLDLKEQKNVIEQHIYQLWQSLFLVNNSENDKETTN